MIYLKIKKKKEKKDRNSDFHNIYKDVKDFKENKTIENEINQLKYYINKLYIKQEKKKE